MTDTEWTPERRKEYELKREGARRALLWQCRRTNAEQVVAAEVDELYPPPPSEYTYGPEVKEPWTTGHSLRRRSDGRWEFRSHLDSEWYELAALRALAREAKERLATPDWMSASFDIADRLAALAKETTK